MRDVWDCILCLKLSQIERMKLRTACTLANKVSKIYSKKTSVCPRTGTFFVPVADWRAKFSPPLNLGRDTPLLSLSLLLSLCLVSILSPLHPLSRCGIRSELWHGTLGNFVASFSCSTYRSAPHESLMTKAEVKKLRRTVWRCISATFLRNEVTQLYKKSIASVNNLFIFICAVRNGNLFVTT